MTVSEFTVIHILAWHIMGIDVESIARRTRVTEGLTIADIHTVGGIIGKFVNVLAIEMDKKEDIHDA